MAVPIVYCGLKVNPIKLLWGKKCVLTFPIKVLLKINCKVTLVGAMLYPF